jgi:hypothetical protein
MPLDPVRNFAKVTVSQGYDSTATQITLVTGDGAKLPDPETEGAFNLVWYNDTDYKDPADDPYVEIVRVTAKSGDTLTIQRGQEGTSAQNHNLPGKTYKMVLSITKKIIDDINSQLATVPAQIYFPNQVVFSGTVSNTYTVLDLSSIVGANRALVILKVKSSTQYALFLFRTKGDTDDYSYSTSVPLGAGAGEVYSANQFIIVVAVTNNEGKLEWRSSGSTVSATITLLAYIK